MAQLNTEKDQKRRDELISLLGRLYQKEAAYDGSWWWSTRPDTRGPFYKLAQWEKSEAIATALKKEYQNGNAHSKSLLQFWNAKLRWGFEGMDAAKSGDDKMTESTVDLKKNHRRCCG